MSVGKAIENSMRKRGGQNLGKFYFIFCAQIVLMFVHGLTQKKVEGYTAKKYRQTETEKLSQHKKTLHPHQTSPQNLFTTPTEPHCTPAEYS